MMRWTLTCLALSLGLFGCAASSAKLASDTVGSTPGETDGTDETPATTTVWELGQDPSVDNLEGLPSDSDVLYEEDTLQEFYLYLSDSALQSLQSSPYEYTEASLTWRGRSYGPIGIRTKGENSWRPFRQKSSFKLDFNRYADGPDRFLGLKGLTFNAMNEDYSMMHERVAYKVYREAGVPAARAHHAIVYVNDELYGLFVMMDSIDDHRKVS